jgi:GalNAc-alpha-(1->4)-GalNAc-alpha-(1->3)-diNAcBac-PP-undecaprenol alpha-1,4-N-acetyl-D-galactosaminyltransferase
MRLTFVIYSLGSGGAERVMSTMANYFAEHGDDVSIVTLVDGTERPFFELNERVRWQPLGTARASGSPLARLRNAPRRIWTLRRRVRANNPDAVVSFMDRTNFLTLAATIGLPTPVIVSERNDPRQHNVSLGSNLLRRMLYRRAKAIVVQTTSAASYFNAPLSAKTVVIPNPVLSPSTPLTRDARQGNAIVAMGRLSNEKGFDLLLKAFASLAERFPNWNVTIWGEGAHRGSYESLRDELGLGARVSLPGRTKTPAAEMRAADLFVLSSRYEGFPNVLAEAMACGAAAISFDCPSGPADLIDSGVNGILVPPENVEALADAMASLMSSEDERHRLGANAERITDTFSLERVMAMWEAIVGARPNTLREQG